MKISNILSAAAGFLPGVSTPEHQGKPRFSYSVSPNVHLVGDHAGKLSAIPMTRKTLIPRSKYMPRIDTPKHLRA